MNFWERVEYALEKAAEDARYLDHPEQQELVLWHTFEDTENKKGYFYRGCLHASWLRKASTIVCSEQNFGITIKKINDKRIRSCTACPHCKYAVATQSDPAFAKCTNEKRPMYIFTGELFVHPETDIFYENSISIPEWCPLPDGAVYTRPKGDIT